jgi:hypothetical protein
MPAEMTLVGPQGQGGGAMANVGRDVFGQPPQVPPAFVLVRTMQRAGLNEAAPSFEQKEQEEDELQHSVSP